MKLAVIPLSAKEDEPALHLVLKLKFKYVFRMNKQRENLHFKYQGIVCHSFVEIISYTLPCNYFAPHTHTAYDRKAERTALVFMRITHPQHQIK